MRRSCRVERADEAEGIVAGESFLGLTRQSRSATTRRSSCTIPAPSGEGPEDRAPRGRCLRRCWTRANVRSSFAVAEFRTPLSHLRERFGTAVLYLHGGRPDRSADAMVQRFQQPGGPPLFLLSLKAGGRG